MNYFSMLMLSSALALAGCGAYGSKANESAQTAGLALSVAFAPNPPRQGTERITVTVKDADGKPVRGAIVEIAGSMPSMSMNEPEVTASDNADGTYSASMKLAYATTWNFAITASAARISAHTSLIREIKP